MRKKRKEWIVELGNSSNKESIEYDKPNPFDDKSQHHTMIHPKRMDHRITRMHQVLNLMLTL